MALDKERYRQAMEYYRQWNEAELQEHIRNAGTKLPIEAWRQYVDLWNFALKISPEPSLTQVKINYWEKEEYNVNVQTLESWRKQRAARS